VRSIQARAEYLMDLMPRLQKGIGERIALPPHSAAHLMTPGQVHLLFGLEQGPATMGELARRAQVTMSTMTEAVTRLVRQGWVARVTDPRDRRVVRIQFTPRGRTRFRRMRGQMQDHFVVLLRTLTDLQQRRMVGAFRTIERVLLAPPVRVPGRRQDA
jgi:DNA-binding MarR family transcriptional regulator